VDNRTADEENDNKEKQAARTEKWSMGTVSFSY
jgi:hypothetical protein